MKLFEFFTYTADGFEQDKTYEPENDISVMDSTDTRKTRLTLKQINSMRLASEAHDALEEGDTLLMLDTYDEREETRLKQLMHTRHMEASYEGEEENFKVFL